MESTNKQTVGKKKQIPMDQAIKISNQIELDSIRLMSGSCKQSRLVGPGPKTFEMERSSEYTINKQTNKIFVTANFRLSLLEPDAETKDPFGFIEASFLLVYNVASLENVQDDAVRLFGETNGIFNAWPYWREYIQNATMRMTLPPLTIPVFRIVAPKKTELPTSKKSEASETKKLAAKNN